VDDYGHTECLQCPEGCTTCSEPDLCAACIPNFDLVSGPGFAYCFPKCLSGTYRLKSYLSEQNFLKDLKMRDRR